MSAELKTLRVRARSLSGSIHVVIGRVVDGNLKLYASREEAERHLRANGWEPLPVTKLRVV